MQSVFTNDDLASRRKAETITAYVNPKLKAALEKWADEESRSVSSLITHLLNKAVEEREQVTSQD